MPFDQVNFTLPAVETDEVLRNLIKARAVIADSSNWCVGLRNNPLPDGRVQHCALGALQIAFGQFADSQQEVELLAQFTPPAPSNAPSYEHKANWRVANLNNRMGHAATLEMFDRAIAARRAAIASKAS